MLSDHCPSVSHNHEAQFSTVDATSMNIKIIDKIRPCFCFISELYLDNNLLKTLNGIQQFQNLQVFSFNFNHVQLFKELYKISNKFFMKKISFMGNPLQWDIRSKYEYLFVHLFPNLETLNPIQENRIKFRFKTFSERVKQMKNKKYNIYEQEFDEDQFIGQTSRYKPSMSRSQLQNTRRVTFRTQYKDNDVQVRPSVMNDTHIKHKMHKNTQQQNKYKQRSTTANQSNNRSNQSFMREQKSKIKEQSPYKNRISNKTIEIKPFEQIQQPAREENQYQLEEQSSIKKRDNSDQEEVYIEDGTGHFRSSYKKLQYQASRPKNDQYKSLAMEFLQAQKNQVAEAFRIRHLKQTAFIAFSLLPQTNNQQQQELKRKAWAAIKMANVFKKLTSK